ncbi:MAG: hypothetical protein HY917_05420, partial [Candidatus Diapherotrites archaeon]|nr:hypothetical protein [Candidatus Diapherotrites archaeon]
GIKKSQDSIPGIQDPFIQQNDRPLPSGEIQLEKIKEQGSKKAGFEEPVQLCVKGTGTPFDAIGKKLKLDAKSVGDPPQEDADPIEVTLQACAIHPSDLVAQLEEKAPGTYYAVPYWTGTPAKLDLKGLGTQAQITKREKEAKEADPAVFESPEAPEKDPHPEARWKAIGLGTATCIGASFGLNVWRHGYGVLLDMLVDCIGPYGWKALGQASWGNQVKEVIKTPVRWMGQIMEYAGNGLDKQFGTQFFSSLESTIEGYVKNGIEAAQEHPAITTGAGKGLFSEIFPQISRYSLAGDRTVEEIARFGADQVEKGLGTNLGTTGARSVARQYRNAFEKELKAQLMAAKKTGVTAFRGGFTEEATRKALEEAGKKVATDATIQGALSGTLGTMATAADTKELVENALKGELTATFGEGARELAEAAAGTSVGTAAGSLTGPQNKLAKQVADKMIQAIEKKMGAGYLATATIPPATIGTELRTLIETSVKGKISLSPFGRLGANTLLTVEEKALAGVAREVEEQMAKKYVNATLTQLGTKIAQRYMTTVASPVALTEGIARGGIREMFKRAFKTHFTDIVRNPLAALKAWGTLGKNISLGVLPLGLGTLVEEQVYQKLTTGKEPTAIEGKTPAVSVEAGKKITTDSGELMGTIERGKIYPITVYQDLATQVKRKKLEKPVSSIPAGAQIIEECQGTYNRPLELFDLTPRLSDAARPMNYSLSNKVYNVRVFYGQSKEGRIGAIIGRTAYDHHIPSALLTTVAIWKNGFGFKGNQAGLTESHLFGCKNNDPDTGGITANANCAATELEAALKGNLTDEGIKNALRAYNTPQNANYDSELTEEELSELLKVYSQWNAFHSLDSAALYQAG